MAEQVHQRARVGADTITPDDPRYADLVSRGSKRFAGRPDYVRLVSSTDQVVAAVHDAVQEQRRLAVRSGGHCLEGFVADPAVRVVIDMSLMTDIYFDPVMGAFAVEAGVATSRDDLYQNDDARCLFPDCNLCLFCGAAHRTTRVA